jgi:methyl-accepting chemotaxis protein
MSASSSSNSVSALHLTELRKQHRAVERAAKLFILPCCNVVYMVSAVVRPCWQTRVLLVGVFFMTAMWMAGFRRTRGDRLEAGVGLIAIGALSFGVEAMMLREESILSMVAVFLALMAYVSLFSYRILVRSAVFVVISLSAGIVSQHYHLIPTYSLSPTGQLAVNVAFIVLFGAATADFLRRQHFINGALLEHSESERARQSGVLDTVGGLQPELETVVNGLKGVGEELVAQASQQADTSAQVGLATEKLSHRVEETVGAASQAHEITQGTQRDSQESAARLKDVEARFHEVVRLVEQMRAEIRELASRIAQTEAMNQALDEIARSLRFLALNAGIEAVRAGEHGTGFAVVAEEMKRMLARTSEDLLRSRELLGEIRERANRIDGAAGESTERLHKSFEDLQATGTLVEGIRSSFERAAEHVQAIAMAATQQQNGLVEVSNAMRNLDEATTRMKPITGLLTGGLDRIVSAQRRIRGILEA